jgi:hypothetical protein
MMELELEMRFGRWLDTEDSLNAQEILQQTRSLYRYSLLILYTREFIQFYNPSK